MISEKRVVLIKDVGKDDLLVVGGKGASLGELFQAGIPVPEGFIVTAQTYSLFLEESNITNSIRDRLEGLDASDSAALAKASRDVKGLIQKAPMPSQIAQDIHAAYQGQGEGLVAVRSSGGPAGRLLCRPAEHVSEHLRCRQRCGGGTGVLGLPI